MAATERDADVVITLPRPQAPNQDEEEEDEEETEAELKTKEKCSNTRKSLEALFAAAEEEFDLMDSPVDTAVKTLKTGREIQKLAVIRNFGDLLDSKDTRDEAIRRILPVIQEVLAQEPSSLDVHCESAVVFKNIIKDKKYSQWNSDLPEKLLNYILQNVENQKENVTAAAWLESLVDVAESVRVHAVTELIVPLAVSQAEPTRRVQRRVISARLLEKLATIIPAEFVRKDLAPCAQMLCQDSSAAVRTTIAQRLSTIAQSLNNSAECVTLLLPCLIELCKDEDPGVREAILNTIAVCLPYFTKESRKNIVVPLLRKCTDQALILRDASLTAVARQLGPWLESLRDVLSSAEQKWFLDTFCRLVDLSNSGSSANSNNSSAGLSSSMTSPNLAERNYGGHSTLHTSCRRMCAYNFPCFAMVYGQEHFNERLLPILERFCKDSDDEVRSTIASGFHEIVQLRSQSEQQALLGPFVELMCSGAAEVVQHLTGNLHKTLDALYKGVKPGSSNHASTAKLHSKDDLSASYLKVHKTNDAVPITRVQLDRILIGCNRLIRSTGAWRSHEAYLNNLAVIKCLIPINDLFVTFVPMFQQEVLTARALPCRIAAAQTLLLIMRQFPMAKNRNLVIDFFTTTIAQHDSCFRRRLLLDIVPIVLEHFSREFFIKHFLASILKLSEDKVSNIRLQLCRVLAKIKQFLTFPNDDEELSSLEKVVRELLISEQNVNTRQLIQQFACELSRAETDPKENRANRAKLAEEKKLWTEKEPEVETKVPDSPVSDIQLDTKPRRHSLRRSATTNLVEKPPLSTQAANLSASVLASNSSSPSAWRTSRPAAPKIAIVRPQPQITITQRSPSPMPTNMKGSSSNSDAASASSDAADERRSKLPLSTARYRSASITPSSRSSEGSKYDPSLQKYRPSTLYTPSGPPSSSSTTSGSSKSNMTSSTPSSLSIGLRRSATTTGDVTDMSRSSGTNSTSSSSSSSSYSSIKNIRRPYGLMKVQSTSAVEKKPSQMSIRVISMN